jgi:rhodanese-related sulfurtransferase
MGLFGKKEYEDINSAQFQEKMTGDNVVILDVRTDGEVAEGAIPGHVHVDVNQPGFLDKVKKYDADKTFLVYCRSGGRSGMACSLMAKNGFNDLYNLKGGIMGWTGEVA